MKKTNKTKTPKEKAKAKAKPVREHSSKAQKAVEEVLESVSRINKDVLLASLTLSDDEARFLVDAYYMMQDDRKRSYNQKRALDESQEPNQVIVWLASQNETLEKQIKRALEKYTDEHPVGRWMKGIHGIGAVLSAGLLAHINIRRCCCSQYRGVKQEEIPEHQCDGVVTAGHIWSFAGLHPNIKWEKGQIRPFNAKLKTLCWKIGQSFMKTSNSDEGFYGKLYKQKKAFYTEKSENGGFAEIAKERAGKVGKNTEAYKSYSIGKLPLGHIDAMARRYAVKIFLSHLHEFWYKHEFKKEPPLPFPIAILGHAHKINAENK